PVFANWTTIPGTTNNIPADDVERLVATFYNQKDMTLGTAVFSTKVRALNATGLYNAASYETTNKSYGLAPGVFNSTAPETGFQGRKNIRPTNTTTYADFYAYVEVYAPANDLGVVVYDFLNGTDNYQHDLPNQLVLVLQNNKTKLFEGYTPYYRGNYSWLTNYLSTTTLRIIYIKSTPNNILWGFYPVSVLSSNVTNTDPSVFTQPSTDEISNFRSYTIKHSGITVYGGIGGYVRGLELRPQWIAKFLPGGERDWETQVVVLQWPAKLVLQVFAGDAVRPLANATVYIKDVGTSFNVSSALTDGTGTASVISSVDYAKLVQTGSDPTHDPFVEVLAGAASAKLVTGFNLLPGTYIASVNYKNSVVWDTFRDQPQHRFIYLGVEPPATATGEDNRTSQTRTFTTRVFDLEVKVTDQSGRPLKGATVTLYRIDLEKFTKETSTTRETGTVTFALEPSGTYNVTVNYNSKFGPVSTSQVISLDTTKSVSLGLPLYDVVLKLVSPRGAPLVAADVKIGGFEGTTDSNGVLVIPYTMPAGSYPLTVTWLGADVSPAPLNVVGSQTYTLTAKNIATVTVQVLGAQNQGLSGATV
ncbi:MAG: carboxypeptidase regulatory-like domain-containing protein, partial [Thermoproteota archaeon]